MSVKGVEVTEKVGGFFRLRGRIFQKWVTNFWTDFFDKIFLRISAVSCTFGHEKKKRNSPPHLCCIRGVLKRFFSSTTHQQWGGAKLEWVVSFVSAGRWQPFRRKRLQQTELQQHCFFVDLFGFAGSSQGYMKVTVFGR